MSKMIIDDVQNLEHGLYRIHWKDGGTSLAAIGSMHSGMRWAACPNWTADDNKGKIPGFYDSGHWLQVDHVEFITDK